MAEETNRRTRRRNQIVDLDSSEDEVIAAPQPRKRLKPTVESKPSRQVLHRRSERARAPKPREPAKRKNAPEKAQPAKRGRPRSSPPPASSPKVVVSRAKGKTKSKTKAKESSSESASASEALDSESDVSDASSTEGKSSPRAADTTSSDDNFIIDKVLAVETHTVAEWAKKCHGMHSHYITAGSIFVPDDDDPVLPPTDEVEKFLVKWKDLSYLHVCWQTEKELVEYEKNAKGKVQRFLEKQARAPLVAGDEYFNPEFCTVDRVLAIQPSQDVDAPGALEYFVKWKALGYESCTWEQAEDFHDDHAVALYHAFNRPLLRSPKVRKASSFRPYGDKIPATFKGGMNLREYQVAGLNWLLFNWYNDRNSLLADEMGLGKTVQTVSYINHLVQVEQRRGPYLIIAPLSTLAHWQREFTNWTDLNAVVYHGSHDERKTIEQYEFYLPHPHDDAPGAPVRDKKTTHYRFDVLITTYEMCVASDNITLARIPWQVVAVDEAHRLKNRKSKLASILLANFKFGNLLLLTGTPLQNNVEELWTLLHFLDRKKFASSEEFVDAYGNLVDSDQVKKLQVELRPFLLRRMKEDVETSLAPKEETIIEVELTVLQKQYYRAIFERNTEFLVRGHTKKANMPSLMNIVMELRKCCNHPFLILGAEAREVARVQKETPHVTPLELQELLVQSCGKLILLDKLLPRLKEQGHRVLIFSQFKIMLDILEDYLRLRGYVKERIDGSITGNDRQAAIDRFCNPESPAFIMLLSTRAGGVGINLTAADTCIIYDSDWNPQNDLQAQARCHRIGQTKSVKIYRLLTAKTYEAHMFHQASMKLGLDQAVLGGIRQAKGKELPAASKEDVENLLKFGAYEMLKDDGAEASKRFSEESVDDILKRSTTVVHDPKTKPDPAASNAMSSFSKATFVSSTDPNEQVALDDPDFWTKVIGLNAVEEKTVVDKTPEKRRCKGRFATYAEENSDGEVPGSSKKVRRPGKKLKMANEKENDDDAAFVIEDAAPSSEDDEDEDDDAPIGPIKGLLQNPNALRTTPKTQPFAAALLAFGYGRWTKIRMASPTLQTLSVEKIKCFALAYVAQLVRTAAESSDLQTYAQRYSFVVAILRDLHRKAHPHDKHVVPVPLYDISAIPIPSDLSSVLSFDATCKHAVSKLQQLDVLHHLDQLVTRKFSPILEFVSILNDIQTANTSPLPAETPPETVLVRLRLLNVIRTLPASGVHKDAPNWWQPQTDDLRLLLGLHRVGWLRGKNSIATLKSDALLYPPSLHPGAAPDAVWPSTTLLLKRAKTLLRAWGQEARVPPFKATEAVVPFVLPMNVADQMQFLGLLDRQERFMTLILEYGVPDVRTCATAQEQREKWRFYINDPMMSVRSRGPTELLHEAVGLERAARSVLGQPHFAPSTEPSILGGTQDQWVLSRDQAQVLVNRIEFFRLLRTDVLVMRPQDLHLAMMSVTRAASYNKGHLPSWWVSPDHDILLMQGVECFGLDDHVKDIWALDRFRTCMPPGAQVPSARWVETTVLHCAKAVRAITQMKKLHDGDRQRAAHEARQMMAHDPHHNADAYTFFVLQKHEAARSETSGVDLELAVAARVALEKQRLETTQREAQRLEAEVRARVQAETMRLEAAQREAKRIEMEVAMRVQSETMRLQAVQREAQRVESEVWSRVQAEQARLTEQRPTASGRKPIMGRRPPPVVIPDGSVRGPAASPDNIIVKPAVVQPVTTPKTPQVDVARPMTSPVEAPPAKSPGAQSTIQAAFARQKKGIDKKIEVKREVALQEAPEDRRSRGRPKGRADVIEIDDSD
ncbi:hypothetical protein SPRG_13475 [Saprolegnia parasitica CBS 223.65]|uniref:Chromodomain-helicase-DNA-binding protein 6 n=1 Tax=Saprolegnia parasitica (strain CBS 223.65) TaxID=695850 RepID=A0A067BU19_SAPPC|nr:hypothetical protein SPRG_13475 [Saprolegnia parasitica CBS 223.65]KDO20330.1 hypothetical protein SPRG_13475 [Saprolegnia parasitica CBS 223.65]|eukprot:XP_012208928.1 hypothetical protein SPRG_13475 [Saprolegnia parasitica CBS 223.65]